MGTLIKPEGKTDTGDVLRKGIRPLKIEEIRGAEVNFVNILKTRSDESALWFDFK